MPILDELINTRDNIHQEVKQCDINDLDRLYKLLLKATEVISEMDATCSRVLELKEEWNNGLARVRKAENLAEENPERFEKFLKDFNKLTEDMSKLMAEYRQLCGCDISEGEFNEGFRA